MPSDVLAIPDDAVAICEPATVELQPGEKVTLTFTPEQSGTEIKVPVLAASKARDSSYSVAFDGDTPAFGPASIPPTDIDDLSTTWIVPQEFETECEVVIKNLGDNPRIYHVQLVGWEE